MKPGSGLQSSVLIHLLLQNVLVKRLLIKVHGLHLHFPLSCMAPFFYGFLFFLLWICVRTCVCVCVCACAFTSVSPLKGLWFQRKPLCFLHLLATITKASAPLLLRLSTWIAAACFYVSTLQNCTVISQSGVSALGTQTDWRGMGGGGYFSKIVGL